MTRPPERSSTRTPEGEVPGESLLLAEGARELSAARNTIRAALARGEPEPSGSALAYERGVSALVRAASAPTASPGALRLAAAACAESGLQDPVPFLRRLLAFPGLGARDCAEIGMLHLGLGQVAEAEACLERALALDASEPLALSSRALLWLGARDYARGWPAYESRLRAGFDPAPRGPLPLAACDGPLDGKRVFVASEQGVGDEIMFASCLPDLAREAAVVRFECGSRLVPLMRRSFPAIEVIARDRHAWPAAARPDAVDCGLWAGSLPGRYRRSPEAFPGTPYLVPDTAEVDRWRARLAAPGTVRRVGLAWTGGLPETARARRSIPLASLGPFLSRADTLYVSLELLDRRPEAAAVAGARLHHFPGVAADLDALAALVASLDMVVSVPGAGAHLAGALGRPVHVLVNDAPTWRYGWEGEQVDWYRSMRVHRRGVQSLDAWIEGVARAVFGGP